MPNIIGVKFRNVGKVYYFDPAGVTVRYNSHVIVETSRGIEYGTVVLTPMDVTEEKITSPLKSILRLATEEDERQEADNRKSEKEAYQICKKKIREHNLSMKLIEVEYTFDRSKVLFYFTADGRIDFRDLVKDLAGIFRTRIELRQIGVRDETKLLGGIGICGRPLCCHTWLTDFQPVSIKMAKEQNLSLNPTKISGVCGRLMCCLNNEAETYSYLNKGMPSRGDIVTTEDGKTGEVQSVNILRQSVKVIIQLDQDEKELQEFPVDTLTFVPKNGKKKNGNRDGGQSKCHGGEKCPKKLQAESADRKIKEAIEAEKEKDLEGREKKDNHSSGRRKNRGEHRQNNQVIDLTDEKEEGSASGTEEKRRRRRRRNRHKKPEESV